MTEEMDLQYYFTTQKKTVILTRQFRLPTYLNGNKTGMMIEVCAGMLDQDNAEQCDKRNRRRNWISPHNSSQDMETYMSPGAVTEILYLFVGEYDESMKVNEGGGVAHEEENIDVMEMSYDEAYAMIASGEIKDKTILLLQHAKINKLV
jgi:nudix-type nucleoside diphosphatase (YffH/AdpP family)